MKKKATRWKRFKNFDDFVDYLEGKVYFPVKRLRIDGDVYRDVIRVDMRELNRSTYRGRPIIIYDKSFRRKWTLKWAWKSMPPELPRMFISKRKPARYG